MAAQPRRASRRRARRSRAPTRAPRSTRRPRAPPRQAPRRSSARSSSPAAPSPTRRSSRLAPAPPRPAALPRPARRRTRDLACRSHRDLPPSSPSRRSKPRGRSNLSPVHPRELLHRTTFSSVRGSHRNSGEGSPLTELDRCFLNSLTESFETVHRPQQPRTLNRPCLGNHLRALSRALRL